METLLIFTGMAPTPHLFNKLSSFSESLKTNYHCQIGCLLTSELSLTTSKFSDYFDFFDIVNSQSIFANTFDQEVKNNISRQYRKYNLQRLRFRFCQHVDKATADSEPDLETIIYKYIRYFENYLIKNNVALVLTRLVDAEDSLLLPIMEAVCLNLNIEILNVDHAAIRIHITDTPQHSSSLLDQTYHSKLVEGLNKEEWTKTEKGIIAYKHNKRSKHFRDYIYRKNQTNRNAVRTIKQLARKIISKPHFSVSSDSLYDDFDFKCKGYLLLLLNKKDNWRTDNISPYYNSFPTIVRNIAISMPLTHSLIVKDHPHSIGRYELIDDQLIRECKRLPNVYYVHPEIDTFNAIDQSDIVFSVASFSGIESLLCLKHLVVFGSAPFFFGEYCAPVIKLRNWESLPGIIDYCLNNEPNIMDIMVYLYSFFQVSTSRQGSFEEDNWDDYSMNIDHEEFIKQVGLFVAKHINEYVVPKFSGQGMRC